MDFVPFMILCTVIVLVVAAWGFLRSDAAGIMPGDEWEPAPDAEAMFHDCLNAKGISIPELRVYREKTGGLIIVGPDDLDSARRAALSDCDEMIVQRLTEDAAP